MYLDVQAVVAALVPNMHVRELHAYHHGLIAHVNGQLLHSAHMAQLTEAYSSKGHHPSARQADGAGQLVRTWHDRQEI